MQHSQQRPRSRRQAVPDRKALQYQLRAINDQMAAQQSGVATSVGIGNWVIEQEAYPGGRLLARWAPTGATVVLAVNPTPPPARPERGSALKTRTDNMTSAQLLAAISGLPPQLPQ